MDKITLTLATAKISLDEVKYNFDAGQNLIVEDNITHSVARRYSNRFLRLFLFFLKKPPKIRNIPVTVFVARV